MACVTWISPGVPCGFHPTRHVHRVAPEVVQEALASDDAGHDRPRVDADPELEAQMADRVIRSHGLAHVEGHERHDLGVIGAGRRHARRDHVGIADRLDLLDVVALGQEVEVREQVVEETDDLGRLQAVRQRREVDDVGEQDRSRGELVRDRGSVGLEPLGDRPRQDVQQQGLGTVLLDPQRRECLLALADELSRGARTRPLPATVTLSAIIVLANHAGSGDWPPPASSPTIPETRNTATNAMNQRTPDARAIEDEGAERREDAPQAHGARRDEAAHERHRDRRGEQDVEQLDPAGATPRHGCGRRSRSPRPR